MLSTGFLKVLGGAFDAVARGLTNVPALPAPEPESDGDALAIATVDALVPRDINEVVHENAWQCVKVMEVNSRGMQGNLGDAIKKLVMTYASATLKKHRHLVLQGSNRQSWEYCCCSIKKGCRYRAKGVLEKGPTGEILRIYQRGDHGNHEARGPGLPREVKAFLESNVTLKPIAAHSLLVTHYPKYNEVELKQVQNYFRNHKTSLKATHFANTMNSWRKFAESRPWSASCPPDAATVIYSNFDDDNFHIAISTNRLLRAVLEQRKHAPPYKQADATWKITWEGHPLLVIGTVMWDRRFVPTVFMLSGNEREQDYAAMEVAASQKLRALARADEMHLAELTPVCCADSAAAIKNGERLANETLGRAHEDGNLLTCYAHMLRGTRKLAMKHLNGGAKSKESMIGQIVAELRAVHLLPHGFVNAFDFLMDAWKAKWGREAQTLFVVKFEESWLGVNKRWSRAFVPVGLPGSSNQLERSNRTVKDILDHARKEATSTIGDLADKVVAWWSAHKVALQDIPVGPVDGEDVWLEVQVSITRETSPAETPTDAHRIPLISQRYESKVEVESLMGIEDEDLVLYPTRHTIAWLMRQDAERPLVSEKERVARITDEGTHLARECAKLWRQLREMPPGGTVEVEGGQTCDFARVVGLLGSFRVLTKLSNPYPWCRARWQCWSCDDGVKKGVCKHALIHTKRAGLCSLPKEFRHLTGGVKRKRGAPRKTAPALSVQLGDYLPSIPSAQPALEAGGAEVPALSAPEPRVTRSRGRVDISSA